VCAVTDWADELVVVLDVVEAVVELDVAVVALVADAD
jgi:hypothetical protein